MLAFATGIAAAEIPFVAPLIVASRPGQRLEDLAEILPDGLTIHEAEQQPGEDRAEVPCEVFTLPSAAGDDAPFYLLPGLEIEISASDIRQNRRAPRLIASAPAMTCCPDAVCDYIAAHGLYRST